MKQDLNRRPLLKALCAVVTSLCIGASAMAANVHFKADPTFEDLGENLEACVSLAGLGNRDVTITVAVTGTATVTYFNPGSNKPPGQNKIPIAAVVTETIPSTQIKNGNVSVCLTSPDIEVDDAPNPNWTVEIEDVEFATATITVVQKGKVVLKETILLNN
jgi:hypothetical protein